jgi:hypothetical protein
MTDYILLTALPSEHPYYFRSNNLKYVGRFPISPPQGAVAARVFTKHALVTFSSSNSR